MIEPQHEAAPPLQTMHAHGEVSQLCMNSALPGQPEKRSSRCDSTLPGTKSQRANTKPQGNFATLRAALTGNRNSIHNKEYLGCHGGHICQGLQYMRQCVPEGFNCCSCPWESVQYHPAKENPKEEFDYKDWCITKAS